MKTKLIFFALLVIVTGVFISMKSIFTDTAGPHAGRVKAAGNYNIETKVIYTKFYAYLLTKDNKTINNKLLSCEIRFFLLDGTSVDIPMTKYGEDGFSMDYYALDYNAYRLTFITAGKTVNAKFEIENVLVQNK